MSTLASARGYTEVKAGMKTEEDRSLGVDTRDSNSITLTRPAPTNGFRGMVFQTSNKRQFFRRTSGFGYDKVIDPAISNK